MARPKKDTNERTIENRRARHDYHILDTLEVGMILGGTEVKGVRGGEVSLGEGFIRVTDEPPTLLLYQVSIGEYKPAGQNQHKMSRPRSLLAHKREIRKLYRQVQQKGVTIVPLKLYFKNGYAKLLIGVAEGKASHDKRDTIRERETKRDIDRAMSKDMRK